MTSPRTRSRELALQALFCRDVLDGTSLDVVTTVLEHAEASSEVRAFAGELAEGVLGRIGEIDRHIEAAADNWDIARLAVVDRNVLRLAVFDSFGGTKKFKKFGTVETRVANVGNFGFLVPVKSQVKKYNCM